MAKNIDLWSSFPQDKRDEYIKFLEIFGALSGLLKIQKPEVVQINLIYIIEIMNNFLPEFLM